MTPTPQRSSVPWSLGDAMLAYGCSLAGLLMVGASWLGASGTTRFEDQISWTVLGSAGVIVIGVGSLAWLLAGRRNVSESQRLLLAELPTTFPHTMRTIGRWSIAPQQLRLPADLGSSPGTP